MKRRGKKVFVGLSGGVDSSVAAYLLKKEGYDVTGVFIKVWQPDFVACTWAEDRLFAMRVCATLGIPFVTLDLEDTYKKSVIDYMLSEYKTGRTPNPDIMCNREVKFGAFLSWALENGAEYVATGHYARVIKRGARNVKHKTTEYQLFRGVDNGKDQSYFLWTLTQEQLKHILFPVGHLQKSEVREIAREAGLPTAEKKDSQGLCFISKLDMKDFLKHFISSKRGDVKNGDGEVIGHHDGAMFVTLGERHGFTVTKKTPADKPYYVVSKDIENNIITVSHEPPDSKLKTENIELEDVNFISREMPLPGEYNAQSRYHGEEHGLTITREGDRLQFMLHDPRFTAPGQSLVIYKEDQCLGGGVIV